MSLFVLVLTGGCALSPQTLMLRPFIDAPATPIGRDRALLLGVDDRRPEAALGRRGGVYDTALISPANSASDAVFAALAERLRAGGFQVVTEPQDGAGGGVAAALQVTLLRLDYVVRPDPLVLGPLFNEIRASAVLSATLTAAATRRSGVYQASSVQRQLGYPTAADNEETVNGVLSDALKQLLLDPELRTLLAR